MLTERELEWLEHRETNEFYCHWCFGNDKERCATAWIFGSCLTRDSNSKYADAAKFEARVAARLAERDDSYQRCSKCPSKFKGVSCAHDAKSCRLLWARIVVEEEMDG